MTSNLIQGQQTVKELEQSSRWERMTLASGIVAAALFIAATAIFIGFIAPGMPPIDAPAEEFASFVAESSRSVPSALFSYLSAAQTTFVVLFFGGLFGVLRRAEGGSGALATAVFAAGLAIAIITPLATMIETHLLDGFALGGVDPAATKAVDGIAPLSLALSGFPQAVVLGGTAALLLSRRFVPRWLGWAGLALGALSLVGTGTLVVGPSLFPITALGTLLFWIWILALSVALLQRSDKESAA
jgi:hypothetical protein